MSTAERPDPFLAVVDDMSVDELMAELSDSEILKTLGITQEAVHLVQSDSNLLETLKITYEFLAALRAAGVIGTFVLLPKSDQAGFLRIIGMTDGRESRRERTRIFVSALEESPLRTEGDEWTHADSQEGKGLS